MHIEPFIYALFGLIIGSFLNVCIYRIPRGKSIAFPGSGCPQCGNPIRFYDNIPVVSYLLLRGKCRKCGKPISIQYPVVELLAAFAFFICMNRWGISPPTFVNSLFLCVIIVLIFIDYHHQILPNILTLPGAIAGILLSPFQSISLFSDIVSFKIASLVLPSNPIAALPWCGSLFGAVIGGGILLVVGLGYEKLRKRQGLGLGDVKMMAMVGAFLGWRLALLTLFFGSLIGSLLGVFLIILRRGNLQTKLAFGVFLGIGATLSLFYGLSALHWYSQIFPINNYSR
jgi:leader peptidase (prepilin peptidase) / N-methyltransferase